MILFEHQLIVDSYSQPHRFYHNLNHIRSVVIELDKRRALIHNYNTTMIAAFFHDIVYKVDETAKHNEIRSCLVFTEFAVNHKFTDDVLEDVRTMIMATKTHTIESYWPEHVQNDTALFLDADLSVLSAPYDQFLIFEQAIRQEFSCYPDYMYYKGRTDVLISFLDKPQVYQHKTNQYLNAQAKNNIFRLLQEPKFRHLAASNRSSSGHFPPNTLSL